MKQIRNITHNDLLLPHVIDGCASQKTAKLALTVVMVIHELDHGYRKVKYDIQHARQWAVIQGRNRGRVTAWQRRNAASLPGVNRKNAPKAQDLLVHSYEGKVYAQVT